MLFLLTAISAIISCVFICFLFKKIGIVDSPDGMNKTHKGNIAYGGGLCIFISLLIVFLLNPQLFNILNHSQIIIILSSLSILILGLIDDIKSLPASFRLLRSAEDPENEDIGAAFASVVVVANLLELQS